jgi:deoxyribodipyrimidine photolyase-related protein
MLKNLLILPNQLFNQIKTMEIENIILYEAKTYFSKYNYNQKKCCCTEPQCGIFIRN